MLLVIGVYTYKVLLLTLLVGIPDTITRHLKRHKLADKNDMKNYFMAHKGRHLATIRRRTSLPVEVNIIYQHLGRP